MKLVTKISVFSLFGLVVTLFQNCSNIKGTAFQSVDDCASCAVSVASSSTLVSDGSSSSSSTSTTSGSSTTNTSSSSNSSSSSTSSTSSSTQLVDDSTVSSGASSASSSAASSSSSTSSSSGASSSSSSASSGANVGVSPCDLLAQLNLKFVDLDVESEHGSCQNKQGNHQLLKSAAHVLVNMQGNLLLSQDQLQVVQNIRGNLILNLSTLGLLLDIQGQVCVHNSAVSHIQNIYGNLELSGDNAQQRLEVDEILDTHGVLYLKNVHLKKLQNHKGKLVLVNSVIDSQLDVAVN